MLSSNKAINAIKTLGSELHFDKGYKALYEGYNNGATKESFKKAFKDNFYVGDELSYSKAAGAGVGAMIGLRGAFGALRGTFQDSNGNFDAPGIPGI